MIMYRLLEAIPDVQMACVLKDDGNGTKLCIPMSEANTDYQAFLKYQAEGGVVLPADEVTL